MQQQQMKTEKYWKVSKYKVGKTRLICAGLIGISIIIMQDFISLGVFTSSKTLDIAALFSVLAFALALPLLAVRLLFTFEEASRKYTVAHKLDLRTAYWIGVVLAPVGIALAFWHIHWIAGLLISVSMILGVILYTDYGRKLYHLDRELRTQKNTDNVKEEEHAGVE